MPNINCKTTLGIVGGITGVILLGFGINELIELIAKYNSEGYDKQGFDREGYDSQGYNSAGYDRNGFNANGYNESGFNRQGYDQEGFNKHGFGIDGFNKSDRDIRGYDRLGFDKNRFDRYGFDVEGFNLSGYTRDGFNREGLDRNGYGRDKYNQSGIDRAGHCRQYYSDQLEQLRGRLNDAYQQMQKDGYRYALYDARVVMEETLKLLVQHSKDQAEIGDKILVNLKICEQMQLLGGDSEFIDKLHSVRCICNANCHELDAEKNLTNNRVYFVIMQIKDLLNSAEIALGCV